MSTSDLIESSRRQRLKDLDDLKTDHFYNQAVWQHARSNALEGGNSFTVTDLRTGDQIDGETLKNHTTSALLRLNERALRDAVSIFELALSEWFSIWLKADPTRLNAKGVTIKTLYQSDLLEEIRKTAVAKAANERVLNLMHDSPDKWFRFLEKILGTKSVENNRVTAFTEAKATRDVLEHNDGKVNQKYLEKAGNAARFNMGEEITVHDDYFDTTISMVEGLITDIGQDLENKMK